MNLELYLARGVRSDGSRLDGGVRFSRISFQGMLVAGRVVQAFGLFGGTASYKIKGPPRGFVFCPGRQGA
jgi:hypothetical protein